MNDEVIIFPIYQVSLQVVSRFMAVSEKLLGVMIDSERFADEADTLYPWRWNLQVYMTAANASASHFAKRLGRELIASDEELFGELFGLVADEFPAFTGRTRKTLKPRYESAKEIADGTISHGTQDVPALACREFAYLVRTASILSCKVYDTLTNVGFFQSNEAVPMLTKIHLRAISENTRHYAKSIEERFPTCF